MAEHLIYFISNIPSNNAQRIDTPLGLRWLRVVLYRGGTEPLEWAARNARPHETVLNTILERPAERA